MAVTHVLTTRSNLAQQVLDDLGNNAQLTIRDSGGLEIATMTLPTTSGTVTNGVLTYGAFVDDTAATGGLADHLRMETSGGSEVYRFSWTGDGVTLSTQNIGNGDTVQVTPPFTYTAPA